MKKLLGILSINLLLLSGCTALTKDDNSNSNLVCEKIAVTGSNIKKRTCMSKELAEEQRKKNQDAMREINKRGNIYQDRT
ncbi:hypothetical protein P4S65_16175 [Pseudoalteromonas sp. B131b]|uniref:hypothetical protein n=1 Tax=unclassified Pseudoalteromonas TaxID=194690 RepID=UPI000BBE6932|nr:hypothetical protein [Pseudoalteromonas sp. 1_2015MBL_MicDiv]ATG78100.1 hypothetical protein AOR04_11535 [Pseudoalteromonas sp. 1_2015MBL_MicDiv]